MAGGDLLVGTVKKEILRTWGSSEICLKNTRTGEEQCASSKTIYIKGSDASHRIRATTSDLLGGNIEIRVVNGGVELSRSPGFAYPGGYTTGALCSNISLHLQRWSPDEGKIYVFLDDP